MTEASQHWWNKPLQALTHDQWEALCDGCGKCCMAKLQDEDTHKVYYTNVACQQFDSQTCRCSDYAHRVQNVPDCIQLTVENLQAFDYLPSTCAYRLRAHGQALPAWHPLISCDADSVHLAGMSVHNKVVTAQQAGPLEHHLYDWDDSD